MPTENIYTVECYNQIITLREGDIVLICPGCIHTLYAPEKGRRIIFQADINPLRFIKEIETLVTIISPLIVITPEDFPSIYDKEKSLLLKIKNEYLSGFSKFYFSRLFKQFTNVSFYKYVNQKRIEKAAKMLTEPNISITNVALSCGFESLSSFIRMFKIVKGCTPTEFRNMYQYC